MKKNILKWFLCLMLAVTCLFSLFACENMNENENSETKEVKLSLNRTEIAIDIMEEYVLVASGVDGAVVWTTENAAIATVENGVVAGVSEGETVITATVGEYSATCWVLVMPSVDVPVINMNGDEEVSLLVSDEWELSPTVNYIGEEYFDGTFTYQSADENVATVDETGKITAVALGTTKIFVVGSWRAYTDSIYLKTEITVNVKDNCVLKIQNNPTALYSYEVNGYGKEYKNKAQLKYEAYDGNTQITDEVTFVSSNQSVATVDESGVITAVGVGETEIFVTYTKGDATYQSNGLKVSVTFPVLDLTHKSVPLVINGAPETVLNSQINKLFDFNKAVDGGKTVSKITDENGATITYNPENGGLVKDELSYGYHVWTVENADYAVRLNVFVAERIINTAQDLANIQTLLGNFKTYDNTGAEISELPLVPNTWGSAWEADQAEAGWYSYGGYYALGRDIDMTGVSPVVKSTHMGSVQRNCAGLYGVFEGAGYKITGLAAGLGGIFGEVSKDALIRNVTIENARIIGTAHNSSIIARNFSGTLENVSITAHLNDNYGGGTIAYLVCGGTLKNITITATGLRSDNQTGAMAFWTTGAVLVKNVNVYCNQERPVIVSDHAGITKACDGSNKNENNYDVSNDDCIWDEL